MGGRGSHGVGVRNGGYTPHLRLETYHPAASSLGSGGTVAPLLDPPAATFFAIAEGAASDDAALEAVAARSANDTPANEQSFPDVDPAALQAVSTASITLPITPLPELPQADPRAFACPVIVGQDKLDELLESHLEALQRQGVRYEITETEVNAPDDSRLAATFGLSQPTLRWYVSEKIKNLYVAGSTAAQFLSKTGLRVRTNGSGTWNLIDENGAEAPYYTVINQETALGGAIYPFLETTGRVWSVVSSNVNNPATYPRAETFGMVKPTLRWLNGDTINDLFVDGMSTQEFFAKTGLQLSMNKGGFVLSKRLSRVMRPYFASGYFPQDEVTVRYMTDLDENGVKVWDGAGLISRKMLERLMIPPGTPPGKHAELLREISRCKRVEFTVMSADGQDKGHAIVSDDLDTDFVLPVDTKKEVRLVNGQKFVGINFVHAHDEMRIDVQSLINLYPFFDETQYAQWLDDEGKLFVDAVRSGKVDRAMSRIDPYATLEDVESWSLSEYFASGGHAMWSASVVRNLMNQHLKRLNETTLERMRLPVPGGRYYVMPVGVGKSAGFQHEVPRGQVRIDAEYGTAWVNDEDWVAMQDSASGQGIRDILGGADNDDALWLHPFTDFDGLQKVLAWRSPNQAGEYIVLQPTIGSRVLEWGTVEGTVTFPPGDSRKLFPRTDAVSREYLGLIDQATASGLGKGKEYSVEVMDEAVQRAVVNAGGLGMYCNVLMVSKAVYGGLPQHPPAPLEDFIDSAVKTGADVSKGRAWCQEASKRIIDSGRAIPELLAHRLSASKTQKALVPRTTDHWADRLTQAVRDHIQVFRKQRDELAAQTMPPPRLFDHAFNQSEREWLSTGEALNSLYRTTRAKILRGKSTGQRLEQTDQDAIRTTIDNFLSRFSEDEHTAIIRGAMVSAYMSEEPSDAVLWLVGEKTENGHAPGIAQKTLQALREVGVLDEIGVIEGGVVRYPGATISEPSFARTIGIQGVWFNWYCAQQRAKRLPVPNQLSDVPKDDMKAAKAQVADLAQSRFQNMVVTLRPTTYTSKKGEVVERLGAFTENGNLLGLITPDSTSQVSEGQSITLTFALAADGNMRAVWRPINT